MQYIKNNRNIPEDGPKIRPVRINSTERRLLDLYKGFTVYGKLGGCVLSTLQVAQRLNVSDRYVRKMRTKLVHLGYIIVNGPETRYNTEKDECEAMAEQCGTIIRNSSAQRNSSGNRNNNIRTVPVPRIVPIPKTVPECGTTFTELFRIPEQFGQNENQFRSKPDECTECHTEYRRGLEWHDKVMSYGDGIYCFADGYGYTQSISLNHGETSKDSVSWIMCRREKMEEYSSARNSNSELQTETVPQLVPNGTEFGGKDNVPVPNSGTKNGTNHTENGLQNEDSSIVSENNDENHPQNGHERNHSSGTAEPGFRKSGTIVPIQLKKINNNTVDNVDYSVVDRYSACARVEGSDELVEDGAGAVRCTARRPHCMDSSTESGIIATAPFAEESTAESTTGSTTEPAEGMSASPTEESTTGSATAEPVTEYVDQGQFTANSNSEDIQYVNSILGRFFGIYDEEEPQKEEAPEPPVGPQEWDMDAILSSEDHPLADMVELEPIPARTKGAGAPKSYYIHRQDRATEIVRSYNKFLYEVSVQGIDENDAKDSLQKYKDAVTSLYVDKPDIAQSVISIMEKQYDSARTIGPDYHPMPYHGIDYAKIDLAWCPDILERALQSAHADILELADEGSPRQHDLAWSYIKIALEATFRLKQNVEWLVRELLFVWKRYKLQDEQINWLIQMSNGELDWDKFTLLRAKFRKKYQEIGVTYYQQ